MTSPIASSSNAASLRHGLRERNPNNHNEFTSVRDTSPPLNGSATRSNPNDDDGKRRSSGSMTPIRRMKFMLRNKIQSQGKTVVRLVQLLLAAALVWQVALFALLPRGDDSGTSRFRTKPRFMTTALDTSDRGLTVRKYKNLEAKPQAVATDQGARNAKQIGLAGCRPMYDWQTSFHPSCNQFHEMDILTSVETRLVNNGLWRDVWEYRHDDMSFALKTLREEYELSQKDLSGQIIDAIISEKATSSPYVANIYHFCGASALYDFASEGTLEDHYQTMKRETRLEAGLQAAKGLRDVHGLGGGEHSPVVHSDIAVRQFVYIRGVYQINDFNTAGLLEWDSAKNETCPSAGGRAGDKNRAPEEYFAEKVYVTEKADVYSLGNIFYKLIMDERKYNHIHTAEAEKLILAGDIPILENGKENSTDPVVVALKKAMHMCLPLKPEDRATAKQVADFLQSEWDKLNKSELRKAGHKGNNKA